MIIIFTNKYIFRFQFHSFFPIIHYSQPSCLNLKATDWHELYHALPNIMPCWFGDRELFKCVYLSHSKTNFNCISTVILPIVPSPIILLGEYSIDWFHFTQKKMLPLSETHPLAVSDH